MHLSQEEAGPRCNTQRTLQVGIFYQETVSDQRPVSKKNSRNNPTDNPQRKTHSRMRRTHANGNRQGAITGLVKQKTLQITRTGAGQAGQKQVGSKLGNQSRK